MKQLRCIHVLRVELNTVGLQKHITVATLFYPPPPTQTQFVPTSSVLGQRTGVEAALRCGDVGQHRVRGTLKLLQPGQVLLLSLGPLLCLQGSL